MRKSNSAPTQNKCKICNITFDRKCYLIQHHNAQHSTDRNFKCEKCGKKFLTEADRDAHQLRHSGEKRYKCLKCPKSFNHLSDCKRHYFKHLDVQPFQCDVCPKGYARKDHLTKHLLSHERKMAKNQVKVGSFYTANY